MKKVIAFLLFCFCFSVYAVDTLVCLRDKAPLRRETEPNSLEWVGEVKGGQTFDFTDKTVYIKDLKTKASITKDQEFYKVSYNGSSYYINKTEVIVNPVLASLKDEATVYEKSDLTTSMDISLPTGSVVALTGNKAVLGNITLEEVQYYDKPTWHIKKRWVNASKVSSSPVLDTEAPAPTPYVSNYIELEDKHATDINYEDAYSW